MNAQSKPFVLASLALLLLSGCVSSDPRPAFDDVSKSVSERTGQSVQWQNAQSGHDEAAGTVAQLLKTKLSAQTAEAIALLNNHSLQASFAEIGISQAELA